VPNIESVTTTKVTFSNSEWDDLTALRVQLNALMQDGSPECTGSDLTLLRSNLQDCIDNLAS